MSENIPHWAEDRYWTEALDQYYALREQGVKTITVDIAALEQVVFDGTGPAYRLLDAMCSVKEHEGWDGMRGAPRLVLALMALLAKQDSEQSSNS